MAQFYAEIRGNRGIASRMGTKESGIWCHIRGWRNGVFVRGDYDKDSGLDIFTIYTTDGSGGYGRKEIGFVTIRNNKEGINPGSNVVFYPIDSTVFQGWKDQETTSLQNSKGDRNASR